MLFNMPITETQSALQSLRNNVGGNFIHVIVCLVLLIIADLTGLEALSVLGI